MWPHRGDMCQAGRVCKGPEAGADSHVPGSTWGHKGPSGEQEEKYRGQVRGGPAHILEIMPFLVGGEHMQEEGHRRVRGDQRQGQGFARAGGAGKGRVHCEGRVVAGGRGSGRQDLFLS